MEIIQTLETAKALHQKGNELFHILKYQEALEAYRKASDLFESEANIEWYLLCQLDIGYCYVDLFDFQKALPFIENTLQKCLNKFGRNHISTVKTYHGLGYYFHQLGAYQKAIGTFQIEWEIIEAIEGKNSSRLILLCNNIGLCYRAEKKNARALEYLKKGVFLLELHKKETSIEAAELYGSLGATYWLVGDLNQALFFMEKAMEISLTMLQEDNSTVLTHYCNLAIVYNDKGNYEKALVYHKKALGLCRTLLGEYHPNTCFIYNNLGVFYGRVGDYKESLNYHQKTLLLRIQLYGKTHVETAKSFFNLGNALIDFNQSERGIEYHHQALQIFQAAFGEKCEEVARIYANWGNHYSTGEKNYSKGLEYLFKSLEITIQVSGQNNAENLTSYQSIGNAYLLWNKYQEATSYFKKILEAKNLGDQHFHFANAYLGLGKCTFKQNKTQQSLQYLQKALQSLVIDYSNDAPFHIPNIHHKNLGEEILLNILKTKALVFFHQKNFSKAPPKELLAALTHCQVGLQLIEKTYKSFKTTESKLMLAESTFEVLELGIKIAYFLSTIEGDFSHFSDEIRELNEANYPSTDFYYVRNTDDCHKIAFDFSEKSKAFLLLSNLQDSQAKLDAAIPQDLLQQEYDLKVELNYLDQRIQQTKAKKEDESEEKILLELQSQYFDYYEEYQNLIRQFEQNYPEYYHLKYDIQTVRIEALQQKLSKEQILIEYFIGEKYIYLFGISQNHFEVIRQEKPSNFTQLIKNFNKGLNRTMFQKYAKAAHELYQILLAPILQHPSFNENYSTIKSYKHSAINQLIIIPHDVLSAVPFEALLCSLPKKNSSLQYADLDYLLLHYDVVYHYSATLWWQSQKKEKKRTLKDNFVGFAPVYQDKKGEEMQELAIAENGVRSVRIGEKDYTALLYSEAEVNGIKAAFEAQELPHSTFLHEEATKSNFEVAVKGKKYVLIAAHGFYNKAQPELSGIIFSPTETDNSEEAILYVNDAYHLDLKETDLVVLSACESGIGKLAKGEGIMAVNRGFLYSGANNVIFTLFKVYDEQSSELTQALFRYILEGKKYAQALRLAKLDLIQQPDTDPKSWAGFVMIGG